MKSPSEPASENRKRAVSLTIRSDLLREAKALNLNASRAAEAGLAAAIKKAKGEAWLAENEDAIRAHNERIATSGVLITPIWLRT